MESKPVWPGTNAMHYPLSVYYDHSCPLCRTEIMNLKRLDQRNRLLLIDCSNAAKLEASGATKAVSQEAMLAAMHVQDASGNWYKAIDAFVEIYAAVGLGRVSNLLAEQRYRAFLDALYSFFAAHRRWLSKLGLHRPLGWLLRRAVNRRTASERCQCG